MNENELHAVLPAGVDDPARPSGGNAYDRRVCDELAARGWTVHEHLVGGTWPAADDAARRELAATVGSLPDDAVVLVDGLIGSAAPEVLGPATRWLRVVLLVHLPLEDDREADVIATVRAVITTSEWTRHRLLDRYGLAAESVRAAVPGVDRALPAPGTTDCGELLCVGALAPHKGQDVLLAALATVDDRPWRLALVGPLDRDPAFVAGLRARVETAGLAGRVRLPGPLTGANLERAYAGADLLVLPSRGETYGMVVTEALARALPVVATDVGGVAEALGAAPDGMRPGLLVPPDDPAALASAVRRWLTDAGLRTALRGAAARRRDTLPGWRETASCIEHVLRGVAA